jgi:chromosome segregation ATPase
MANWNGEDFPNDPPEALAGGQTLAGCEPLAGGDPDWPSVKTPEPDESLSAQSGRASTQGVSAEETFRRLAELHRQMLEKQYNNDAFRSELERMGVWIRSMDTHLAQLANVETLAEQHRVLLNDMLTKAQGHRQLLLDDMGKHQKVIDDALKAMGNPLKKLDDLLEEQTRSFQTFSSVVNKIWWIFLSAALSGALIGDLVASFFHA